MGFGRLCWNAIVLGKLTNKRFQLLSEEYEQEQAELEQSIETMQAELNSFNADSSRADKFIELVKRYTDFTELTTPMIIEFIEKIVVHEADKSSGERQQDVEIYLNFIGKFELPLPESTPEEIAAAEKAKEKRAWGVKHSGGMRKGRKKNCRTEG